MGKKKVLVINLGWEQEPLIDKLSEQGHTLFGVHYDNNYYKGVPFSDVCICDLRDLDAILSYAEKIKPDAVVSDQCDYSHFAQAMVSQTLGLSGPTIDNALISSNKFLQRQKAKEAGLTIPEFKLIASFEDIHKFVEKVGYPIILKPIDNRGSFGVSKVEAEAELYNAYIQAVVNSHSRLVIAEQFIKGYEITVDGYCFNGEPVTLALAKKNKGDEKVQVSLDIRYPGKLPADVYEKAIKNNEVVTKALGYTFGMTHSEYMVDADDNIYLVEAANRGGGVYTSEIIVPAVSGVDLLGILTEDIFSPNKLSKPESIEQNEVILKFFSFNPGKIKKIEGTDVLLADKRVLKFRLAVKEGDTINPIKNDANRHGFVIVKIDKGEDIVSVTNELINIVKVIYE